MDQLFADRIQDVPRSFIREILTVALQPDVISFAGGLPNRLLFPVDEIREVTPGPGAACNAGRSGWPIITSQKAPLCSKEGWGRFRR